MFMLVDCNCFYVSCERVFRPDLNKKPVVVLSNNDGCVIALSKEAKCLGIKMCDPWFKIKNYYSFRGVVAFSSNYELYADLSYRIMNILESLAPKIEVYSIDEAFLDLSQINNNVDIKKIAVQCQAKIKKYVGIPVRVGSGPTKTIAKIASYGAKYYTKNNILNLSKINDQYKIMQDIPVEEVWGVGLKLSNRLSLLGIRTAADLLRSDIVYMKKMFGISLVKTIMELNGQECMSLQSKYREKKQIIVSRSFSQKIDKLSSLQEAVSDYTARAAEKLRRGKQLCKSLTVFLRTNTFGVSNDSHYERSYYVPLLSLTDDTRELITAAKFAMKRIYRLGYSYNKVGIVFSDLSGNNNIQIEIFNKRGEGRAKRLMRAIDEINFHNKGKVMFLAQGVEKCWSMKRDYQSPKYTTSWHDLPGVM